jgi:hypothetical protein
MIMIGIDVPICDYDKKSSFDSVSYKTCSDFPNKISQMMI